MNLNSSQISAIEHGDGPCLVLAGPGSGKTTVLTLRVKRLIENGIPANEILVITFTKAAALEMKERFNRLSEQAYPVTFGTFHSLFWGILREELHLKADSILMGENRLNLIKESIVKAKINQTDQDYIVKVASEISYISNSGVEISNYVSKSLKSEEVRLVYSKYQELKHIHKMYDFDDMLLEAYKLLTNNDQILDKWQNRFSYFLVDEMQDMNGLQYRLMVLLAKRTNNLFCVGDDDQSIYNFRGADPEIMLTFPEDFQGTKLINLNQNYRCPANIIDASRILISNNKIRYEKELDANKSDGEILFLESTSKREEAVKIADEIAKAYSKGVPFENIAILYRNHTNACQLLGELLKRNIPIYIKEQFPNVFTNWIIQDIEAYFEIAIGNITRQRVLRIMNRPNRFLMRGCLESGYDFEKMRAFYDGNQTMQCRIDALKQDILLISKMSGFAALNYIRKAIGYDAYLRELSIKNGVDSSEYMEILDFLEETIRDCKNIKAVIDKISFLKLKIDYENRHKKVTRDGKVGFFTLHSSKGLEFDEVYILECNEGVIPSKKAVTEREIEAERRLFYVGITRTKNALHISSLTEKNRDRAYPSRFISEIKQAED